MSQRTCGECGNFWSKSWISTIHRGIRLRKVWGSFWQVGTCILIFILFNYDIIVVFGVLPGYIWLQIFFFKSFRQFVKNIWQSNIEEKIPGQKKSSDLNILFTLLYLLYHNYIKIYSSSKTWPRRALVSRRDCWKVLSF